MGDKMKEKLLLMSTMLKMPQPRKNYIIRKELFDKLSDMNEYSVILVKGGAGTGKTTLITSLARENSILNLKWISLDESCDNVFLFWNYFIEAVGEYLGDAKQDFMSLYDSNIQRSNVEQLLVLLINELDNQEDIYIVLDDFYYIKDVFLSHTLEFFLKNIPDNVHMILLTRWEPMLYMGTLNMEGRLLVIDENDLRLPSESGIRFLRDTLKLNLSDKILDFMNNTSEGWIGGLQLIAAVSGGKSDAEIMRINLGNKFVGDYLTREIYEVLDVEEKEFLVITSILSYFNEEICLKLIENLDFNRVMDNLTAKNFLIICIDEEKRIYRYHNILREYLKVRFKGYDSEAQRKLHMKAADILNEIGDYNQSIEQLLMAEDYRAAMKLILELPQNLALFSYVDRIPDAYDSENPDFAYQCFFYYYTNMDFEKCRKLYEAIKDNMAEDSTFSAFKLSNMFLDDTFKINEMDPMTISEIDMLPLRDTTKAYILIKEASFLYAQCRYDEALHFLDRITSYPESSKNFYLLFYTYSIRSQIFEDMGELNKSEALYRDMNKILCSYKNMAMLNSSFHIGITGVNMKRMDLKAVESSLKNAEKYINETALSIDRGYKYNLAEYKFMIGETEQAMELVGELMKTDAYNNIAFMAWILRYVFKRNKLSDELVQRFIESYKGLDERFRSLDDKLLYADIIFNQGDTEAGIELTDQMLKYSRMKKIKLKLVQAALLKIGMIYDTPGKKREIINLFREALFYSCEDKILHPYFMESEVSTKVIKQYQSDILSGLNPAEKLHFKDIMKLCKIETKSILSEREIDVLREIANGASNKEIAENLCISLATVKSHIINIYSKLQVNNRVAAVETAKKIGIWQ